MKMNWAGISWWQNQDHVYKVCYPGFVQCRHDDLHSWGHLHISQGELRSLSSGLGLPFSLLHFISPPGSFNALFRLLQIFQRCALSVAYWIMWGATASFLVLRPSYSRPWRSFQCFLLPGCWGIITWFAPILLHSGFAEEPFTDKPISLKYCAIRCWNQPKKGSWSRMLMRSIYSLEKVH